MSLCSIVGIAFSCGLLELLDFDYLKESVIHSRKSGHTEFYDRTAEVTEEAARRNRANIRQMLRVAIDCLDEVRNPNVS